MRFVNLTFILMALFGIGSPASAVEITISCGAVGKERELCESAGSAWAQETGNTVTLIDTPETTTERYFKYLDELGRGDERVDVYQLDVIWPGLLANHFIDLKQYFSEADIQRHLAVNIENNTVAGRLVGMPWFTDVGLLFYRADLLDKYGFDVPETWSELAESALYIQTEERKEGNDHTWGYVFQGEAYEGLTCNVLEWIHSYGGGTIVDAKGNVAVSNLRAVFALANAASWVGTISPSRVTTFNEEDARITFELGNAVFMRNWPYAWALVNADDSPVAGKVEIAPLPKGGAKGERAATLGGWQLGVSKYSSHPEEAADLVRYMTSSTVQKQRAIEASMAPTIVDLYKDQDILQAQPFFAKLRPILDAAVARPSDITGRKYMAASTMVWEAAHYVLQGTQTAVNNLAGLQDQLELLKARGGW